MSVASVRHGPHHRTLLPPVGQPAADFTKNILAGGNPNNYTEKPGNYFPTTSTNIGFVGASMRET
jgi:hypothetical protein